MDWDDPGERQGRQHPAQPPIMGADVRLDEAGFDIGIRRLVGRTRSPRSRRRAARRTRSRPGPRSTRSAGSGSPTGRSRWPEQERALGIRFDTIVVCTVTGSTHAGMIAGFAALPGGGPRRVLGIDASATLEKTRAQVERIARNTAAADRAGPRPAAGRDHRAGGLGGRLLRHPGRVDGRRHPAQRPPGRDDQSTRCTRASPWPG